MTTSSPVIALQGVTAGFPGRREPVLALGSLTVARGERVALIGSSGAGKTTLLRLISGRHSNWSGRAEVLGLALEAGRRPPRGWRRRVGFIFQDFALIDRASVFANVRNGRLGYAHPILSLFGHFEPDDEAAVRRAIAEVELTGEIWQRADALSGGQQQRVAVARCLAQDPALVLADEPVSNLDPSLAATAIELLVRGAAQHGSTLVMTLHQPEHARRYADRVIGMRGGSIVFDGPPSELSEAAQARIYARDTGMAA